MSRRITKLLCAAALTMSTIGVASAASSGKYQVEESDESRVQFVSDATLEKISGVGHSMHGQIDVDPANLSATKGTIELDVKSIKTGVDLRDEHLNSDAWLDSKKFPKIKFQIGKVEGASSIASGQSVDVTVKGKLTMHGVTRDETATAKVRMTDKGLKIQASFKVNMENYKISVPQVVRLKVAEQIELNVMLMVKPKA
jgi:polyisoprenoid-binding protein YceI